MFKCNRFKIVDNKIIGIYDTDILGNNIDLFKKLLRYYKIPYRYFNGKNTDKLFIGLIFTNKKQKKAYKRMVTRYSNFKKLTRAEQQELRQIRKGYYLSKKYLNNKPTDAEYGIYEPLEQYSDFWNNKDCSEWEKVQKGIKYDKKTFDVVFEKKELKKTYKSQIDQILEYLCKFISNSTFKGDSFEVYKKMITLNKDKIIKHMGYLKNNPYNSLEEFLECIIIYGVTHTEKQSFWKDVYRKTKSNRKPSFRG